MNKTEFNNLINSPRKNIGKIELSEITKVQNEFPYCENLHNLSLLKTHLSDDINFNKTLAISAIYSSNRKKLFEFIHPPKKINFKNIDETSFLFEDWLKDSSLIKKPKINKKYIIENIKKSTQDNNDLTTETLAKTYIEQGHYERAIQAYQILSLKYPKKSGFFANQIKNIENILK
tara:strand:+ start:2386 stop:2913 length:528 start_codon:yes stop_codon:yes gene_type:complete